MSERSHAVGLGERTRLACCQRRLAVDFVHTICFENKNGKMKFAARRRKPHAGGVCSPIPIALGLNRSKYFLNSGKFLWTNALMPLGSMN
jgi:hypothetical protein